MNAPTERLVSAVTGIVILLLCLRSTWAAEPAAPAERRNWFETPFDQAVAGAPRCPRPEGPLITEAEMRQQAHGRIERGTSCWLAKKCEDSNALSPRRGDPAARAAFDPHGPTFAASSVWVTTERRYVTLQGCVGSAADEIEAARPGKGR